MPNSVKIQDVAASAGVSTATVSYVMNGKAEGLGITLATRQRVLEAIQKTGYRPNRAAREMAIGQQSAASLPAKPAPDLATILAAAGYSLVPVTSVNDLPQLTGIGLVGVLYRQADATKRVPPEKETSPLEGHASSWPGAQATATGTKTEIPEITPSTLAPEPVAVDMVAVPVQAPMEDAADTPSAGSGQAAATTEEVPVVAQSSVVTAACGELSRTVPGGTVISENSQGTDGARRSPSTLTAEPVVASTPPSTTQQRNNCSFARA